MSAVSSKARHETFAEWLDYFNKKIRKAPIRKIVQEPVEIFNPHIKPHYRVQNPTSPVHKASR